MLFAGAFRARRDRLRSPSPPSSSFANSRWLVSEASFWTLKDPADLARARL